MTHPGSRAGLGRLCVGFHRISENFLRISIGFSSDFQRISIGFALAVQGSLTHPGSRAHLFRLCEGFATQRWHGSNQRWQGLLCMHCHGFGSVTSLEIACKVTWPPDIEATNLPRLKYMPLICPTENYIMVKPAVLSQLTSQHYSSDAHAPAITTNRCLLPEVLIFSIVMISDQDLVFPVHK